jgi:teichuronic acid biosynthesis glycosyltransferase TuaH
VIVPPASGQDSALRAEGGDAHSDVVFAMFSASWAFAVWRGMIFPEDRLAQELLHSERVRRLLVVNPYRSVAGVAAARLRRRPEAPFPDVVGAALHEPRRLARRDPAQPARSVARYERSLHRAAQRQGLERPAIVTGNPLLAGFGDFSWAGPVTYYAWDDWRASVPHERWWPAYDEAFARIRERGRRVASVSAAALARVAPTGMGAVVPNGLLPEEWADTPPVAAHDTLAAPRLLYIGSLDSRVDAVALAAVARAFPDGTLTLIGNVLDTGHYEPLRELANVEFCPWATRPQIVAAIMGSDACLIPHVKNGLTEAMSPLKLYEYLAGGRPVAATDLQPIRAAAEGDRVTLVQAGGDFPPAVRSALAAGPAGEDERRAFLARNAWSARLDALLDVALAP